MYMACRNRGGEGAIFWRAFRAAAFIVVHVGLALLIIAGIYIIQLGLLWLGDPKLFDWVPLRYVFDAMDAGLWRMSLR
jgi:hypothetical protein